MKKIFMAVTIIFTLSILNCNTIEPETQKLELSVEDYSCTEVWLNVTGETGSEIILNRDDIEVQRFTLTTSPQTGYDDSLLPNKTYTYQVSGILNQESPEGTSSNKITVTTLDTTSHNFTWEKFTFGGEVGSSSFNDCAIISENNIWCVGEILIRDTSENGYTQYCYFKWDGKQWEKGILKYFPPGSIGDSITTKAHSIYAFAENDVWISGGAVFHWNGMQWKTFYNTNAEGANKIWGTSSSDLYFVGRNGNIAHYNGSQWSKIESGTNLPVRDIWGDFNVKTNRYEILAVAAEISINRGSKVLRIDGNSVTEENNKGLSWGVGGLWLRSGSKYYIAGAGIHYKHKLNDSVWNRYSPGIATKYVGYGITGNDINNVFAAGSFLEIVHFNGVSWHNYNDEISSNYGALGNITVKGNMIVTVGYDGRSALVIIGKRN